jgi:hypothetical protein
MQDSKAGIRADNLSGCMSPYCHFKSYSF